MKKLIISLVFLIIIISFLLPFFIKGSKIRCDYFCNSFNGRITEVKYGSRGFPAIRLNNNENWIYFGTDINVSIELFVDDSIVKKSKSFDVYIIRSNREINISSNRGDIIINMTCNCERKR